MPGETVSGDACTCTTPTGKWVGMIADGLGHGPIVADAAQDVCPFGSFESMPWPAPPSSCSRMHMALRDRAGAAVAVAEINTMAVTSASRGWVMSPAASSMTVLAVASSRIRHRWGRDA